MKPNNPFLITGYYSPEYFCNREQETKDIIRSLHNGVNITLISPRRIGKTGLIKNVFYKLNDKNSDIAVFYMDIYATQNLGDFVRLFASTVLGQLDSAPQKALKRVGQFIKSCRPVLSFDELTGAPKFTIDIAPSAEQNTLQEIFEYLQSFEKRCYIAIDEFQQIAEYPEKGIEALLRSYIQFIPNTGFIFAGSKQHIMQEMFLSSKRPFYQSTKLMSIDAIDRADYCNFATKFFKKQNRELNTETFNYIYDEFNGHTWYIQVMLNRLYSYNELSIDIKSIKYTIEEIVSEFSDTYEARLLAYSPNSIRLLKAIAKERCVKEIQAGEFIAKYKLKAASSVSSALKKLIDNELIYKTPDGYIVYDRFMAIWLRRQQF